jgi:proline dehydrogenase
MLGRFLRNTILALSRAGWARRLVMHWGFAWRVASRFVAGQTLDEALAVTRGLNERGINVTLDYLGESTTSAEEARAAADEVIRALEGIQAAGVRANVSIKLSQFGLALAPDLCRENLHRVLQRAQDLNNFVRIDMEDSSLTDATLDQWETALAQGCDNTGIVIQSYLYRSEQDIRRILRLGGRVRLCKGAYDEPPALAFPIKADVDKNYDHLAALLMDGQMRGAYPPLSPDGRVPPAPALATHDANRVVFALEEMKRREMPRGSVEFQMLYGIRRDLQDDLAARGYPVRVYVPYGEHWYPYFMRRLAERPANIWFFVSNFFRK